eukprot:TRINITY_DN2559_c0_g2_i2.p1 TRINITY_DN2559_c0_g2~~TRINITY_DN2559_c0_g2_i2.p1  ORF type:complete len:1699 (+),score=423.74 TRINITY_DN2559_c0_g2_i2:2-5098(+)
MSMELAGATNDLARCRAALRRRPPAAPPAASAVARAQASQPPSLRLRRRQRRLRQPPLKAATAGAATARESFDCSAAATAREPPSPHGGLRSEGSKTFAARGGSSAASAAGASAARRQLDDAAPALRRRPVRAEARRRCRPAPGASVLLRLLTAAAIAAAGSTSAAASEPTAAEVAAAVAAASGVNNGSVPPDRVANYSGEFNVSGGVNFTCNGRHPWEANWTAADRAECTLGLVADAVLASRGAGVLRQADPVANSLSEFLAPLVFHIPDPGRQNQNGVTYDITNIACERLSIGSAYADAARRDEVTVEVASRLAQFGFYCTANWYYEFAYFFRGSGWISLSSSASKVIFDVDLKSAVADGPPESAAVSLCQPEITFDEATLHGGVVASIVNLFQDLMKQNIANGVTAAVCTQLDDMVSSTASTKLVEVANQLARYTTCKPGMPAHSCCATCNFSSSVLSGEQQLEERMAADPVQGPPALVDLTQGIPAMLISRANSFLSKPTEVALPNGSVGRDLGVNALVRQLLNGTGTLRLALNEDIGNASSDPVTHSELALNAVTLSGLDTFTRFDVLNVLSQWTLAPAVALREIGAVVEFTLSLLPPSDVTVPGTGVALMQAFTLSSGVRAPSIESGLLAALELERALDLQVGPLMSDPLSCGISTMYAANITELTLTMEHVARPVLDGLLDVANSAYVQGLVDGAFLSYESPVLAATPNYVNTEVRALANEKLASFVANASCPPPVPFRDPPLLVDFQTSETFTFARTMLQNGLTPDLLNEAIRNFTDRGTIHVQDLIDYQGIVEDIFGDKNVTFRIANLRLAGLDSVDELRLLEPLQQGSPYVLKNSLGLGGARPREVPLGESGEVFDRRLRVIGDTLRLEVDFLLRVANVNGDSAVADGMENNLTFSLGLNHVHLLLAVLAKVDVARVARFRLRHLTVADCYLALLAPDLPGGSLRIEDAQVLFNELGIAVNCHSCSSQSLRDYAELLASGGASQEEQQLAPAVNHLVSLITDALMSPSVGKALDYLVRTAPGFCEAGGRPWDLPPLVPPLPPDPPQMGIDDILPSLVAVFVVAFAAVVLPILVCACRYGGNNRGRQRTKGAKKDVLESDDDLAVDDDEGAVASTRGGCCASTALRQSAAVPGVVAVIVPLLLLICIAIFLVAHLAVSLSVDIRLTLLSATIELQAEQTSLMRGLALLVQSNQLLIALLFYFLSVFWAYLRVFAMIALWYTPVRYLTRRSRGKVLRWLGKIAKWCMIDLYAVGMVAVAVNVGFRSPNLKLLPQGLYSVELVALPQIGVLLYIVAQVVSQIVAHVQLHYHRADVARFGPEEDRHKVFRSVPADALPLPRDPLLDQSGDTVNAGSLEAGTAAAMIVEEDPKAALVSRRPSAKDAAADVSGSEGEDEASAGRSAKGAKLRRTAVCVHRFRSGAGWLGRRSGCGSAREVPVPVRVLTPLTLLCGCGCLLVGVLLPSYTVDASGLAAIMMDFGSPSGSGRNMTHSAITLVGSLVTQATADHVRAESVSATLLIAAVYAISTFVAPLVLMLCTTVLWCAPLTRRTQERLLVLSEGLADWQYLEVYIIAVILTATELRNLVEGIAGAKCAQVDRIMLYMQKLGFISPHEVSNCIELVALPRAGFYFLLAAAVILNVMVRFVCKLATRAVEEKALEELGEEASEDDDDDIGSTDDDVESDASSSSAP